MDTAPTADRVSKSHRSLSGSILIPVLCVASYFGARWGIEVLPRGSPGALALAFPASLVIVFTAGLLDLAGFRGQGDWDLPRLLPLVLLPYCIGVALARRRYA